MTDFLKGVIVVRGLLVVWVAWVTVSTVHFDVKARYGDYANNQKA